MHVVGVVAHRIHALRLALRDVVLVRDDRELVAPRGVLVAPDPLVDVRRHVNHVTRAGHEREQPVRRDFRLFRSFRGLDEMNVEMERERVMRVAIDNRLDEGHDLGGPRLRFAVRRPVAPGSQVHHRFRVEGLRVEVVGERFRDLTHRFGEGLVRRGAVFGLPRVALRERVDVRLLPRGRLRFQRHGFLDQLVRFGLFLRGHHRVDVGTEDQRLSPVGHRELGIEPRGLAKRAAGLGVVESVRQVQPLIHEKLSVPRKGRHGKRVRPEVLEPWRDLARRRGLHRVLVFFIVLVIRRLGLGLGHSERGRSDGQDGGACESFHHAPPVRFPSREQIRGIIPEPAGGG